MNEMGYLDFHSHVLPGIDDGSKSEEMSKEMLRLAYEQGVRTILATPHSYPGGRSADGDTVLALCAKADEWAKEIAPDFSVLSGNEIYYRESICEELEQGKILPLHDSRYVLVEFSPGEKFRRVYEALKELVEQGYYPVTAHVERVSCLFEKEDRMAELIHLGVYMQANCEDFMGGLFDRTSSKLCRYMKNGYIHFLGSDCHNLKARPPMMEECIKKLYKKMPEEIVNQVIFDNQKRFLEKKYI